MTFVVHKNQWWWGRTHVIVQGNGLGLVEVQYDKAWISIAYIRGLEVLEPYRKSGIGTRLIQSAIDDAKENGMQFVKLAADKNNTWLVDWYERLGFFKISSDENEFEMIKIL